MDEQARLVQEQNKLAREKRIKRIITVVVLVLVVGGWLLMGGVKLELGEQLLTVSGTMSGSLSVPYDNITALDLRDSMDFGSRSLGVSSLRTQCGTYRNKEFDRYRLYAYGNAQAYIVVHYTGDPDSSVLVFNRKDAGDTRAVYEQLLTLTGLEP